SSLTIYIYTLSLHDALPSIKISKCIDARTNLLKFMIAGGQMNILDYLTIIGSLLGIATAIRVFGKDGWNFYKRPKLQILEFDRRDPKSTRLNSSHVKISYA